MTEPITQIFREEYRALRPRADMPEMHVRFYPFANINNTIRLREGRILARVSDLLQGAPENVLRSIAHILIAKLYRKPVEALHASRYRRFVSSSALTRQAHRVRQMRGRKQVSSPQGHVYDLDVIFEELNARFFSGCWGARNSPGARRSHGACWVTMTRPTTPSSSAASSTGRKCPASPSSTWCTTRCCT